jgi:hypothetical protein
MLKPTPDATQGLLANTQVGSDMAQWNPFEYVRRLLE